ncbi:MAG TPA: hypothetical protein VED45_09015 [Steroidobacteraceae bacterium]|nr:hypothetical protein [Steroidobacteraceae bacterium]
MHSEPSSVLLAALGAVRVRGMDAVPFLQGQLSNDVTRLGPARSLLAGYHNPQGRVIALLRLVQLAPDDLLAILPRELAGTVAQRLARFVLRAKAQVAEDSAQWAISGVLAPAAAPPQHAATPTPAPPPSAGGAWPAAVNAAARRDGAIAVRVAGDPARWLLIAPARSAPALSGCEPAAPELWQRCAIAAGEPEVYAATSEEFVAQMLNLDVLGAIAFDKGCYTGQEVIARAHYRGRVKRRMQRFLSDQPLQLQAGDSGVLPDRRSFRVVRAAGHPDGRCEFLAVTAVAAAEGAAGAERAAAAAAAAAAPLNAQQLELPYRLPD